MNKSKEGKASNATSSKHVTKKPTTLGRKRDHTLDTHIIEAAINILVEVGFDSMTMDMVAARAKAGKASVYRRWSSKIDLVKDALFQMSHSSVELGHLPDTGTLRNDLLAILKPHSVESGERKLRVLAGLGSFFSKHPNLAKEVSNGVFGPWTEMNRVLMQRAVERGEISPHADIEMACQIIVSMTSYRNLMQNQTFDKVFYSALLDNILLPALKIPNSPELTNW